MLNFRKEDLYSSSCRMIRFGPMIFLWDYILSAYSTIGNQVGI